MQQLIMRCMCPPSVHSCASDYTNFTFVLLVEMQKYFAWKFVIVVFITVLWLIWKLRDHGRNHSRNLLEGTMVRRPIEKVPD